MHTTRTFDRYRRSGGAFGGRAIIRLRSDDVEIDIAPGTGGSIAAFRWRGQVIMRPAAAQAVETHDPLEMAMFPLVPWSNRIAHGRFSFGDHDVALPLNFGDHPHAIHGHGWQRPWEVVGSADDAVALAYTHAPDAWPWGYRADLRYRVTCDGFDVILGVENRAADPMPAGLGLHPYYVRTPDMTLHARLDGWWDTDADVMPIAYRAIPAKRDWSDWLHSGRTTDHVFSGWDGTAELVWPEHGRALTMTASDAARWLVVYAPTDEAIACIEPVTHPTDALNQPGRPGVAILMPGERFELRASFHVRAV